MNFNSNCRIKSGFPEVEPCEPDTEEKEKTKTRPNPLTPPKEAPQTNPKS